MKNNDAQKADVYKGEELAGLITRTAKGSIFEYTASYINSNKVGIALNMPVTSAKYETTGINLHTFFAGLLPEGLRFKALVKKVKTSEDDLLSLLIEAGDDCIGDISVVPHKHQIRKIIPTADIKSFDKIIFKEILQKSLHWKNSNEQLTESSIPGVQEKISAGRVSIPLKSSKGQKSYILKLNTDDKPFIVENEQFFLSMAKNCGLSVAASKIVKDANNESGLLVERFDRNKGNKIHQEDACQFLDRYPADKYRISFYDIAKGLEKHCTAPIIEISKLIRLKVFSYIICNGDLHARNVSIQIQENGNITLSPVYDLLSTIPYGDKNMALKLEGRDNNFKRTHFISFGKKFDIKPVVINSIINEICQQSKTWIDKLQEIGFNDKKTKYLKACMEKRISNL